MGALILLGACSSSPPGATPQPGASSTPSPSPTSFLPPSSATVEAASPTPVPLALVVNGEAVTLDEFNAALQRFHAGVPDAPTEEALQRVTADYIAQILLSQGAAEAGFVVDDAALQARLDELAQEIGGAEALEAWQAANFYTPETFGRELRWTMAAAWMRDQIAAGVPTSMEQVRARQVRASSRAEADEVLAQLAGGTSFDLMAEIYDPLGLGELGWFPRGYLLEPAIEDAAFALEPGAYSGVIETSVGFHIIQVTDRAADRPLEPDALWTLQKQAVADWVAARQAQGAIEILVP